MQRAYLGSRRHILAACYSHLVVNLGCCAKWAFITFLHGCSELYEKENSLSSRLPPSMMLKDVACIEW